MKWLITGIGSGLGRALAQAALDRGDTVCGTTRNRETAAAFTRQAPGRAFGLSLDLHDQAAIRDSVEQAEALTGGLDCLVNNAGHGMVGAIEETTMPQIRDIFDINVFSAIALIQNVLPHMRARRSGTIINITSVSGLAPWSGTGIYGATKFALECIGQTLSQEVSPFGIRVMNVAPGALRTGFSRSGLTHAAHNIADYDTGTAHQAAVILGQAHGQEKGDPQRAAAAILKALAAPELPLHLLLGEDAIHYAENQMTAIARDIRSWHSVSTGISFDE